MLRSALFLSATLAITSCSPSEGYCAKSVECSDDSEEEKADDQAICAKQFDGLLGALRANTEPECSQLADALDAQNACKAALTCDEFNAVDDGGKCDDETEGVADACEAIGDAEANCESLLLFSCGAT